MIALSTATHLALPDGIVTRLRRWYQTSLSQCFPFYMNQKVPSYEHRECAHFYAATGLCSSPRANATSAAASTASSATSSLLQPLQLPDAPAAAVASPPSPSGPSLVSLLVRAATARASAPVVSDATLEQLRSLVSVGIKVVTKLRNHVHFILHSIHARYPGMRVIVADDEYVGVGGEEWRRMSELFADYNVTYVQLTPRSGLSAGRNALVDACTTKCAALRPHSPLTYLSPLTSSPPPPHH